MQRSSHNIYRSLILVLLLSFFSIDLAAQTPKWTRLKNAGPPKRRDYGMVFEVARNEVMIFAGTASSGGQLSDQWKWTTANKWFRVSINTGYPYLRTDHGMAYDSNRKTTVLFGGWRDGFSPYRSDTWEWNGATWNQKNVKGPSGRDRLAMTFDAARKKVVLYGGYDGNNRLNDTWTFDGKKWKKMNAKGPPGLLNHTLTYDAKRQRVLLFGGYSNSGYNGETWAWNGTAWSRLSQTGPSPRADTAMSYYGKAGTVILFGGRSGDWPNYVYHNDTWSWDGAVWTQLSITGPSSRSSHAMVYDSIKNRVFLFGGDDPKAFSTLGDTWAFTQ